MSTDREPPTPTKCQHCGMPFAQKARGRPAKFCSYPCRDQARDGPKLWGHWRSYGIAIRREQRLKARAGELARTLKHEGVRAGEIIAYRAWRVINEGWFRSDDDRLHSVLMRDYVWYPDKPASGDVRTYGIYSFRDMIRSKEEYGYDPGVDGPLLLGTVKIWGEIVEHEAR